MDMEFDLDDEFDYEQDEDHCYSPPLAFPAGNGDAASAEISSKGISTSNPFKSQDSQSWVYAKNPPTKPIEKKPFLRKGTGTARYYKGKPPPAATLPTKFTPRVTTSSVTGTKPVLADPKPKDDIELQLFELLEQMTEGQSFCSNAPIVDKFVNTRLDISPIIPSQDHHQHNSSITTSNNSSSSSRPYRRTNSLGSSNKSNNTSMTKIDTAFSPSNRTARSRVNSIGSNKSNCSSSSLTSSNNEKQRKGSAAMSPEVLQRVLELVRNESEKNNGKSHDERGNNNNNPEFHGALLTARTMELELEIKKFHDENQKLDTLMKCWQAKCYELENEQKQFNQLKDKELRFIEDEKIRLARKKERLDKIKEEYENKLQQQELNCKTAENSNDETINRLKTKIYQLEKELQLKNTKFITVQKKLNDQIQILEDKNKKLRNQLELALKNGRRSINNNKPPPAPQPQKRNNSTVIAAATNTNPAAGFVVTDHGHGDFHEEQEDDDEPVYNMPASPVSPSLMYASSSSGKQQKSDDVHHHPRSLLRDVSQQTPRDDYQENLNGARGGAMAMAVVTGDGIERILPTGDREIRYSNGTTKTVSADSRWTKVNYYNGDIRETKVGGMIRYYYHESGTWHTTYPDGLEVVEFPNGQIEKKNNTNGITEITYPNGCIKHIYPCGKEECIFGDKTVLKTDRNGDKILLMANGQQEYQTKDFRKRIYPDGTMKIVYSDGSQETRYPNGRVRMKDSHGKLIHDAIHHNNHENHDSSPNKV